MKFLSAQIKQQKGFTLIELLIVIAILGILATAVLSAINPVEQINRGRDTGTQSDAEQLISAIQRFNASNGYFPWQTGASDTAYTCTGTSGSTCTTLTAVRNNANPAFAATGGWTVQNAAYSASAAVGAAGSNVLSVLGSSAGGSQELQNAFINRVISSGYNTLYIYSRGQQGDSTYVCFKPQSGSFKTNAIRRWNGGTACSGTACTCSGVPADLVSSAVCDIDDANNTDTLYCLP